MFDEAFSFEKRAALPNRATASLLGTPGKKISSQRTKIKFWRQTFDETHCNRHSHTKMEESTSDLGSRPFKDFPEEEELIIQFWRSCNAFEKSYQLSVEEKRTPYVFYDGPPFATVPLTSGSLLGGVADIY